MKRIKWTGVGTREAHGFTWESGDVISIEDEEIALDLLTQPNDGFSQVYALTDIEGVDSKRAEELAALEVGTVEALAGLDDTRLAEVANRLAGVGVRQLRTWRQAASDLL